MTNVVLMVTKNTAYLDSVFINQYLTALSVCVVVSVKGWEGAKGTQSILSKLHRDTFITHCVRFFNPLISGFLVTFCLVSFCLVTFCLVTFSSAIQGWFFFVGGLNNIRIYLCQTSENKNIRKSVNTTSSGRSAFKFAPSIERTKRLQEKQISYRQCFYYYVYHWETS